MRVAGCVIFAAVNTPRALALLLVIGALVACGDDDVGTTGVSLPVR